MTSTALYLARSLRRIEAQYAGLPLMERAGAAAADLALQLLGQTTGPDDRDGRQASSGNSPAPTPVPSPPAPGGTASGSGRTQFSHPEDAPAGDAILILAGPGNNGGDALVVARLLRAQGKTVHLVFAGQRDRLPADAAAACQRFVAAGGELLSSVPERGPWRLIVDGLFGIGLQRPPAGNFAELIEEANRLAARDHCPLLALDCPSGLDADSGATPGQCIRASHTLTFISGKPGLLTAEGPDHCGEIAIAGLDLALERQTDEISPDGYRVSIEQFAAHLCPRRRNSHKGSSGSVGILGGSQSMSGAALLAGRAALKLGAGRVYLGLLDPAGPNIDLLQPELMFRRIETFFAADLQALVCGPGLGQSAAAAHCLEQALQCPLPLVLDADALNLLAVDHRLADILRQRQVPAILTPHPAEAARLLGRSVPEVQNNRLAAAGELARRYRCAVALKGCGTVLAAVDGRWWINSTGNPGMATAGMGDVLSGLLGTLLAQQWPAETALLAAVHLHGAAADRCVAANGGEIGLTASEVIDAARALFNRWHGEQSAFYPHNPR